MKGSFGGALSYEVEQASADEFTASLLDLQRVRLSDLLSDTTPEDESGESSKSAFSCSFCSIFDSKHWASRFSLNDTGS